MPVINRIAAFHDEMTEWRHDFHRHPELGFEEVRTSGIVAEKLKSWGLDEVHTGIAKTGVVGILHGKGGKTGRAVGLRADMDCLPMTELGDKPHMSTVPGKMHGCGHDGHTTMLLGAARYLSENRNFDGTAVFIFQPAEEGLAGGKVMVEEGLFDRFPCDEVFALHNWPPLEVGKVAVIPGPAMAATDEITIIIQGKGGHAAMPNTTVDPVVIGAHIVTQIQGIVSRQVDPLDNAVVSITRFNAGDAFNVIPDSVTLGGTVRTFKATTQDYIQKRITDIVTLTAQAHGATATLTYHRGYPATVNDAEKTEVAKQVAAEVVGAENVISDVDPCMGGEDFSYMLDKVPGAYLWLGQAGGPSACMVHNPHYDFNDEVLPIGASVLARFIEARLPA